MAKFQPVRGMRDFLAGEAETMRHIEEIARNIAHSYGFQEVITPILESYDLLARKAGEEIRERMYAFDDRGGRRVALRPEFTASIARLVATALRNQPKPLRIFCVGSLYRYDEPQFGRYREFWQTNFELFGSSQPEADAEILLLTNDLLQKLGLKDYSFKTGHVGIVKGVLAQEDIDENQQNKIMQLLDKKLWQDALATAAASNVTENCLSTLQTLLEIRGKDIPSTINKVKQAVKDYPKSLAAVQNLEEILNLVVQNGAEIDVQVDAGFARGLEYYTGAIFEVLVPQLDISIGGGGRYDNLVELFGGEATPAVGIAHGVDRVMLAIQKQEARLKTTREERRVVVVPLGNETKASALKIAAKLRNAGLTVEVEVMKRSVTRALEDADRRGAAYAVIVGARELGTGKVVLRNMVKREQKTVEIAALAKEILDARS